MNWHLSSYGSLIDVVEALVSKLDSVCERVLPIGVLPIRGRSEPEIRLFACIKDATISNSAPVGESVGHGKDARKTNLQLLQNLDGIRHHGKDRYEFEFQGSSYPFILKLSSPEAFFAQFVQASSLPDVHITIATAAKNMGMKWQPSRGGFEILATGELRLVRSEGEVFEIVRMPYIPPEKRHLWPEFALKESGLPPTISKEQLREWADSVPWTDTWNGGEPHQFTFRTSGDERAFVHVVEAIRELGYDGMYYRKKWRYLDLDGYQYFSCGATIETTSILNRKKLRQAETPWAKNPEPWIPQTQS